MPKFPYTLLSMGSAEPPHKMTKTILEEIYRSDKVDYDDMTREWLCRIIQGGGIDTIPCVIDPTQFQRDREEYDPNTPITADNLYSRAKEPWCPTTEERIGVWKTWSVRLAAEAGKDAIAKWGGDPSTITGLVTNSSTGVVMPGLDVLLVDALGLTGIKERTCIDNVGCAGGFSMLKTGQAFGACLRNDNEEGEEQGIVLCISAEICSVHINMSTNSRSEIVGNALFGDGSAAAIIGPAGMKSEGSFEPWEMGPIRMLTGPIETRKFVTVELTDKGYLLFLDKHMPDTLSKILKPRWREMIKSTLGIEESKDCAWAVHPGGKAVLNAVQKPETGIGLAHKDLEASWEVLRTSGNIVAPSILMVTQRLIENTDKDKIFVLGFGPGMTVKYYGLQRPNPKASTSS